MNLVRQAYLEGRVTRLEQMLTEMRDACASNLSNPGNEDDTLEYIMDVCSILLGDNWVYKFEDYVDD